MRSQPRKRFTAPEEVRSEFVARLKARRAELEEAILVRVQAVSKSDGSSERAEYVEGLRMAVVEALDYAITSIEDGRAGPLPRAAAAQARRAARGKVSLDTVLRRYAAGDRQVVEFLVEDAEDLPTRELQYLLRIHGIHVDRFMEEVAREYVDEMERVARSPGRRMAEDVERLLLGKPIDTAELGYKLSGRWHVAVIAAGEQAQALLRSVAYSLGARLLLVDRGEEMTWAWLGSTTRVCTADVHLAIKSESRRSLSVALGEPAEGLEGWRFSHSQAQAALWVALRKPNSIVRYADDLLLAVAARDEVLARSLHDIYLLPLLEEDGDPVLCTTLRAYLASGCNAATAAAALSVDRHTIQRRLRKVEERLGRMLSSCRAELELTLRMQELDEANGAGNAWSQRPSPAIARASV